MGKKIQDAGISYYFLKEFCVDPILRSSYSKYQIEGMENLPTDGSVIWATNHSNALMDALVLLASTRTPKVFIARADIFKKKFIADILTFLKIMPIYRIRDGFDSVKRNDAVIEKAVDVMSSGTPLIIFPEATHRTKHSLLKLSKGIFHITISLYEKSKNGKPVYIQPIGIEYGDYFRFRSTALVRYGRPINVTEFLDKNSELTQPVQMQMLREVLTERMAELIAYVPDDEDYDAIWEYAKVHTNNKNSFNTTIEKIESKEGKKLKGLMRRQAVNRYFRESILTLKKEKPEEAQKVLQQTEALRLWRIQNGISVYSVSSDNIKRDVTVKSLLTLIGMPYYLFSMVASLLIWLPSLLIISKIKDDAFYNSARFCVKLGTYLLTLIIWAIIFFNLFTAPWAAIVALLAVVPAHSYFIEFSEYLRKCVSDWRWLLKRKKAPKA